MELRHPNFNFRPRHAFATEVPEELARRATEGIDRWLARNLPEKYRLGVLAPDESAKKLLQEWRAHAKALREAQKELEAPEGEQIPEAEYRLVEERDLPQ